MINVSSALAFVPLPAAPIYSATKAAIHSYTQSLRFQLEETGVEVIEIMPPAVKTDMTAELVEGGASVITTDELVKQSFASLKSGALEIRPGQSKQLAVHASPRSRFHQQAALEGLQEAGAGRGGVGNHLGSFRLVGWSSRE